jgi:hypothetical protein
MSGPAERLRRLHHLAELLAERDLARLQPKAQAVRETAARLDALRAPQPVVTDPAYLRARQAHLQWSAAQRLRLVHTLALHRAAQADAKATAARSVARAQVLAQLAQHAQKKRS